MPIKLKKSDIKDKIDNPKEGYMILGFDERGTLVWKDSDGAYGSIVPSVATGNFDVLNIGQYLTVGYRLASANIGLYTIAHGVDVAASGLSSYAQGADAEANGDYSTAKGEYVSALGNYSYAGGKGWLTSSKLTASGESSFVYSYADTTSGTFSDYSVILGGQNHNIGMSADDAVILGGKYNTIDDFATDSVIIGGLGNTVTSENTAVIVCNGLTGPTIADAVYVPRLVIAGGTLTGAVPGTIEYHDGDFYGYTAGFPNGTILGGVYQTVLDTGLTMTATVGGFSAGVTKVGDLSGKTFTKLFDDMLFPRVAPNFIAPISSFVTFTGGPFDITPGPVPLSFRSTLDRGQIRIVSTFQNYRSGVPDITDGFIYSGSGLPGTVGYTGSLFNDQTPSVTLSLGANLFRARIHFSTGPISYYSNGDFYQVGLASDYLPSVSGWNTISIEGVYLFYATTVNTTPSAQAAVSFGTNPYPDGNVAGAGGINLITETGPNQQVFDVPVAWGTVTNVWTYAPAFNSWSLTGLGEWTNQGIVTHSGINYTRYRYAGTQRTATRIRIQK